MNKIIINISVLFFTVTVYAQAPYGVKSAKIDFVWNNGLSKGTKTLIFDDSGRIEKIVGTEYFDTTRNLKELGLAGHFNMKKAAQNSIYIQTKDSVFAIDIDSMVATSRARFYLETKSFFPEFKKLGEKEFLGRVCDIMETPLGKMLMWKGICLNKFYEGAPMLNVYEYATLIDETYIIKDDEFKIPTTVKMK